MQVKTVKNIEEIKKSLHLLEDLYGNIDRVDAMSSLVEMINSDYIMGCVFEEEKCVGVTGISVRKKIELGNILQIDDFMIDRSRRGVGIGKMLVSWIKWQAMKNDCNKIFASAPSQRKEFQSILSREGFKINGFNFIR